MSPTSKKLAVVALALFLLPLISSAQQQGTLGGITDTILAILNTVVVIVMVLALIYFFWGLAQYILSAGDDAKKAEGRNIMIYGVVALFVMATVWGLVGVLNTTFLGGTTTPGPDPRILTPGWNQ